MAAVAPGSSVADEAADGGAAQSCAEAKFFLQHCPTVQMDGDNDGIPCEQQWCNSLAGN